jgi:hypothetical protein
MCDHTPRGFLLAQRIDCIARPAKLERADLLKILTLQIHLRAEALIETLRSQHRRAMRVGFDSFPGLLDVG